VLVLPLAPTATLCPLRPRPASHSGSCGTSAAVVARETQLVVSIRRAEASDHPAIWALNDLPNVGHTADPSLPLDLPRLAAAPRAFPDLADVTVGFVLEGGDFIVAEYDAHLVGMGGYRPLGDGRVEMLRVRVHPAMRRRAVGRAVMAELERRAAAGGHATAVLDTATNQPEAVGFYRALGYREDGTETRPEWSWTLVYFSKPLSLLS